MLCQASAVSLQMLAADSNHAVRIVGIPDGLDMAIKTRLHEYCERDLKDNSEVSFIPPHHSLLLMYIYTCTQGVGPRNLDPGKNLEVEMVQEDARAAVRFLRRMAQARRSHFWLCQKPSSCQEWRIDSQRIMVGGAGAIILLPRLGVQIEMIEMI